MDNLIKIQKIKNNNKISIREKAEMIFKYEEKKIIDDIKSEVREPIYEDGVDINDDYFIIELTKMMRKSEIIKNLKKELKVKCDCSNSKSCTSCVKKN